MATDLIAIAYSEFDKIHGPRVIDSFVPTRHAHFNIQSLGAYVCYIILDKEYCDQVVAVEFDEYVLLSWSTLLENPKYVRNNFSFAFSILLKSSANANVPSYAITLRKLATTFMDMELEYEFLSSVDSKGEISGLLKQIYDHIVAESHAVFPYSSPATATTHYFNINLARLPVLDTHEASEYSVPIFVNTCVDLQVLPFDISIQHLIIHIDGISHLKKIAKECGMDIICVKRAIQLLLYYGVVVLSDVFKFSNIYKVCSEGGPDLLASQDNALELMAFSLYPNYLADYSQFLQQSSEIPFRTLCADVCSLVGDMQPSCTFADLLIKCKAKYANICKYVDVVRLLAFLQYKQIIQRVYEYPVYIHTLHNVHSNNTILSTADSQISLNIPSAPDTPNPETKFMKLTKAKTIIHSKHHNSSNSLSSSVIANIAAGYANYMQEVLKSLDGSEHLDYICCRYDVNHLDVLNHPNIYIVYK